ncbi:MAG: hypothetical protein KatS3mg057_1147 [Herpetosiphonaceae bacterium]|nr:MAG: hypothetical protein KatS3mg057_1147 [Herpetosiphonaceae bacterium]
MVCTQSDAVNVFITLSARSLNEQLYIVARSITEEDEPKLLRAGANRAITPASLGGRRLAGMILRPAVLEFLDVLVHSDELEMWLEEIPVNQHGELVGQTLGQARLRDRIGVTILAIRRTAGQIIPNPASDTLLMAGDILIALGTRESLLMLGGIGSQKLAPLAGPMGSENDAGTLLSS